MEQIHCQRPNYNLYLAPISTNIGQWSGFSMPPCSYRQWSAYSGSCGRVFDSNQQHGHVVSTESSHGLVSESVTCRLIADVLRAPTVRRLNTLILTDTAYISRHQRTWTLGMYRTSGCVRLCPAAFHYPFLVPDSQETGW